MTDDFRHSNCDGKCDLCDNFLCKGVQPQYFQIAVITFIVCSFAGYLIYHLTK